MKSKKQIIVFIGCLIKDNKVLMVQRDEEECPDAHLKWELPGGKVDHGETPEESLTREFLEETGIKIKVGKLLPYIKTIYWEYSWGEQQTLVLCYKCEHIGGNEISKDHHVKKVDWIDLNELKNLETLPGTSEFIKLLENDK